MTMARKAMLPFVIFLLAYPNPIVSDAHKYVLDKVADSEWVSKVEYSEVPTMGVCTLIGYNQMEYYTYSHNVDTKICQLGAVVPSNSGDNKDRIVTYRNPQYFGMVQGNKKSGNDPSINIILPNGKVCPPSDHGIPDFDLSPHTYLHGLVEHQGVIYKVAGKNDNGVQSAGFKLDLKVNSPAWESIAPALSTKAIAKGGLVGHNGHLFLVPYGLCTEGGNPTLQMYNIATNKWTNLGSSLSFQSADSPGVAVHGSLLYIINGKKCNSGKFEKRVQVLDMNDPTTPTRILSHVTIWGVSHTACTYTQIDGKEGILCAGGFGDNSETRRVQFLPIENGDSTEDGYQLDEFLYTQTAEPYMINFGNGQLAFYGGKKNGVYRDTINLWDPVTKSFINDDAIVSGLDSSSHAAGLISKEYVNKKCLEHI